MHLPLDFDESSLDMVDRLGLAFCRLNEWQWDEFIGEKPKGFDDLPDWDGKEYNRRRNREQKKTKSDYIRPVIRGIESIIGEANASRCWWKFGLGKSEREWFMWYLHERMG